LTATVGGPGSAPPSGKVSFIDTSSANALLGTAILGAGVQGLGLAVSNIGIPGFVPGVISLASGDFNGDGIPDLALVGEAGNTVTLLLGNGDGSFKAATQSPATGQGASLYVVVGDFNGDGIPDLAALNVCGSKPNCTLQDLGSVAILLGNGDGTFKATAASPTSTDPYLMVAADFNGDGIADLAVANRSPDLSQPTSSIITILLGNGDGTFTAAAGPVLSGLIHSMVAEDFNGDRIPDLVMAAWLDYGPSTLTEFLGHGDGTFAPPTSLGSNFGLLIASADFNADGKLDLTDGSQLLLGKGDGTFTLAPSPGLSGPTAGLGFAVGDFNGDGIADLAIIDAAGDCTVAGDGAISVYLGKEMGCSLKPRAPRMWSAVIRRW
jgi:hypothetical protein